MSKRLLLLAMFAAQAVYAQTDAQLAGSTGPRGIVPTGNYSLSNIEAIDNVYGTVSYNIPLASLAPGRAGMSVGVPLIYNSTLWDTQYGTSTNGDTSSDLVFNRAGGWSYGYEYAINLNFSAAYYQSTSAAAICSSPVDYEYYQLSAVFPDGSQHVLRLYGARDDAASGFYQELPGTTPPCPSFPGRSGDFTYYTVDGTYVKVVISANTGTQCGSQWKGNFGGCWATHPWTMYFPDGRQVSGYGPQAMAIADRNGNQVQLTNIEDIAVPVGTGAGTLLLDDMGRQIKLVRVLGTGFSAMDTITETGANNSTLTWTVNWARQDLNGPILYDKCLYQSNANAPVPGCAPPSPISTVTQIAFPADPSGYIPTYKFGYDLSGWGQLNSVTLPSGASVAYTYLSNAQSCQGASCANPILFSPPRNPVATKKVTYCDESDQATPTQPGASCPTAITDNWGFNFVGTTESSVQSPDGGITRTYFTDFSPLNYSPQAAPWNAGLVYKTLEADGSITLQTWQQNTPYSNTTGVNGTDHSPGNPVVAGVFHCVAPCGTGAQYTATVSYYDRNGNATTQCDYDWASSIPPLLTSGNCPSTVTLLRATGRSFATPTSSSPGTGNDDSNGYWNPNTNPVSGGNSPVAFRLPVCQTVTGGGSGANGAVSQFYYDNGGPITAGNLTKELDWDSTQSSTQPACSGTLTPGINAISQTWTYSPHGNPASATDGKGNTTAYNYSNDLYLTSIAAPLGRTTNYTFDPNSGLLMSQTDYNGLTQSHTYDNLGRQTQLDETGAAGLLRRTSTTYEGANRRVITRADSQTPGDQQIVSVTDYDQLGRVRLTRQLESGSQSVDDDTAGIKVQTRYGYSNPLSYRIVSNPYRANTSSAAVNEATMGWTVMTSDWSRQLSSATAYGPTLPSAPTVGGCPWMGSQVTCYSGNVTTASDEAGVVRRTNTVDGPGRLTKVVENGLVVNGVAASTTNVYDVLGNLTGVTHTGYPMGCATPQGPNANRSFFYDSLGRLAKACNPESGTTTYTYDNDSNLKTRTDARGVTATLNYDAVNRLTSKTYSDNANCLNPPNATPCVNYNYPNGQDFLASVSSGASTYNYSNYDAMARPGAGSQTTGAGTWTFPSVVWTPQGQVRSLTYPSGRVVTTNFDAAGRVAGVAGTLNGTATPYVSGTSYAAQGALMQWSGGDTVTRTMTYNQRLQMTQVAAGSLMTVALDWGPVNNNGTLKVQTITRPGLSATTNYGYDGVNRLTSAAESTGVGQSYVYDNVGNRAVTGNSTVLISNYTPQTSLSAPPPPGSSANWPFDPATNHWVQPAAAYDAAGNTTGVWTQTMRYDAESRMTSWSDSSPSSSATFTYDGDGRRVTKTSGGVTTTYVYDPIGNLALESGGTAAVAATSYLTRDHLGSVRLVTNGSGGGCLGAHDYLPFGEEIPGTLGRAAVPCYPAIDAQSDTTWKFGGQERDAETGFDNFLARHFGGAMGRFLSVDPGNANGSAGDPQSWNGYAYGGNSPLVNIDPSGTCTVVNGQYQPDSGNPCPSSTGSSITVTEGGPDDLLLLAVKLFLATAKAVQQTQQALTPVVNAIRDFRQSSNCAGSLVSAGQAIGGTAVGGYSATVGFGVGVLVGGPATAVGGAALFGGLGTAIGSYGGGGLGGVAGTIFCSQGSDRSGGGSEQSAPEKTAVDYAKQIERDLGKEARREFHDIKGGGNDRTLAELKADAKVVYGAYGKTPPRWMQ